MPPPIPSPPSGPAGDEDVDLISRVRRGEEEALQKLHRRYAPLVFHLACRGLDRAAAEEVVQDTFLAVWRRAADFDAAKGSFRTWLLSIGRHRMLDELRARSRRPQASGEPLLDQAALSTEEPLPDEALWQDYQRDAISEALAALPEPQRAALRLAFFADLTHEEVAKVLKVPLGTAKTRIRSGLRQLERHLGGLVALLLVALGSGSWLYHRRALEDARMQRAVHLLADSQTRALRLTPPGASGLAPAGAPGLAPAGAITLETGTHATFRGALGADIAVLTLTHFPPPPEGAQYMLWVQTQAGWKPWTLQPPDRAGKALQVLEAPGLGQAWPLRLRITVETQPTGQPTGPVVVEWQEPGPPPVTP